jgi:hypothetical protein
LRGAVLTEGLGTLDKFGLLDTYRGELAGRADVFPAKPEEMVQTDLRSFKRPGNTWTDALEKSLEAVSDHGAVWCAPEVGKVPIIRQIDIAAQRFLYSPNPYGMHNAPLTSDGPGFVLHVQAAMASAIRLNGQGAGVSGIGVLDDTSLLTASAIKGNVDEVWAFGIAVQCDTDIPYAVDFWGSDRSGISHFHTAGGATGLGVHIDGIVGRGRVKSFLTNGIDIGAGMLIWGVHPVGGVSSLRFLNSENVVFGAYTDAPSSYHAEFAPAVAAKCVGNRLIGGRAYHSPAAGPTRWAFHFDSTNGDVENNLIDAFSVMKQSGETDWDFLCRFTAPANQNRLLKIGHVDAPDVVDLCAAADRQRVGHVGYLQLTNGKIMRNNGPVALTDAAPVVVDCIQGDIFTLSTNAARTISNPTASALGRIIEFHILNNGGSGAITWSSNYKLAGAWVDPANGLKKTIAFRCTAIGADVWEECYRTPDHA